MHIAVSVSSGSSLFGKYLPTAPSKVIFISGEDDSPELQRRLHKAIKGLPPSLGRNINQNLHFIDLADSFELFTERSSKGEVSITEVPNLICSQIQRVVGDSVGLVIIDPVSRFRGGEENLAADTTRFVQALQLIRDQLNTCVLTLHHVNKNAGTNGANQNNARGSSAFIDGVRLVYQLNPLSDLELKKYGDISTLPKLLTLQSVKSNYGKPIDPLLLARCDDGSLELFNAVAGDHLKRAILQEIKLSKISKTKFKETYGDAKGKFSLSEKAMLRTLDEFEVEKLIKIPNRGVMALTELGESLLTT
jgi:RecA-family ATPase